MQWRTRTAAAVLSVAIGAAGVGAWAQEDPAGLGGAIFGGTAERLESDATARQIARLPCQSCHGADGLGGEEGRAPPIEGPALARDTRERPAYDQAAFSAAVREGRAAGGRELNRLMPRYDLSDEETAALFDHLAALPQIQRTGVSEGSVAFGIPAVGDREASLYLDHLRAAMEARLGGDGVHGRQVELVLVSATTRPGEAGIFAALALPRSWLPSYRAAGVPVIFPFGQLEGGEDAGLLRDFLPSRRDVRRALAERLAVEAAGPVAILPAGAAAEALTKSLRLAGGEPVGAQGPGVARELVVLDAAALESALSEAPEARLWLDRKVLAQSGNVPPPRETVAYTDLGALLADPDVPPLAAHARIAGAILAEVLLEAGRDLTRAGFLRAFGQAYLADFGLDYRANPLTGSAAIRFDTLPAQH